MHILHVWITWNAAVHPWGSADTPPAVTHWFLGDAGASQHGRGDSGGSGDSARGSNRVWLHVVVVGGWLQWW